MVLGQVIGKAKLLQYRDIEMWEAGQLKNNAGEDMSQKLNNEIIMKC